MRKGQRSPMFKDLSGLTFGRLLVIAFAGKDRFGHTRWECLCTCGNRKTVDRVNLRAGHTRSCGCLRDELVAEAGRRARTTHGKYKTPTYESWQAMRYRCENPKNTGFDNYGGRGIKVCERWRKFENFLSDMGERAPGMTLDRIDVNGNYEPGNCRWATVSEQNCNRRCTVFTPDDVRAMRREWIDGASMRAIAIKRGVSKNTVSAIVRGRTWRHVQ